MAVIRERYPYYNCLVYRILDVNVWPCRAICKIMTENINSGYNVLMFQRQKINVIIDLKSKAKSSPDPTFFRNLH